MVTRAQRAETVIIGAGQAGLSTAYHLARVGRPSVVLETHERVGDVWRQRFDSLRLYNPAQYSGLPGMAFPAPAWTFPTKDDMAAYLEAYAQHFALPVHTGVTVSRLSAHGDRFTVTTDDVDYDAANVVVATGTFPKPRVPAFAAELDPEIRQLHSASYHNPADLLDGPVLVVGAAHSGADIAYEVAATHQTVLCGPDRGQLPFRIEGRAGRVAWPVMRFAALHVFTERTPLGRAMRPHVRAGGGPLLRVKRADLAAAGVQRVEAKVVEVRDGRPLLADGQVLEVANVVWCTGFGADVSWIDLPVLGDDGWPRTRRGAVESTPGLWFVGVPFLYAFASMLVTGVGRDAEHVARNIARRMSGRRDPDRLESAAA